MLNTENPEGMIHLEAISLYIGNTSKLAIPKDNKEIKHMTHECSDPDLVLIHKEIITGIKKGNCFIKTTVTSYGEGNLEETTVYLTPIHVLVGTFKLKTYYSTLYRWKTDQYLKDREQTFVSVGKTARVIPALSYGVFTNVSYESSNEEIASVKNDGIVGLVTGISPGTVTITAFADINGEKLSQSVSVKVKKEKIPVSNPKHAKEYDTSSDWVGDRVYFGLYEQDNNYGNGKESICWRVLEVTEDSILLLSEYGLESKNINDSFTAITWETCTLRKWLNNNFINNAFTVQEQSAIVNSKISTPDNKEWGTKGGNDTIDKIFLLSVEEATNPAYGFYHKFYQASPSRTVKNTEYATENDGYTNKTNGNTCWWLRSPGSDGPFAAYFFTNGSGTYSYFVGRRNDAVRPALRLKLSDISFAMDETMTDYPYIIVN